MDIYYVALVQNQGGLDESNALFKYTGNENFTAFDKACEKFHYELCWRA